MRSARLFLGAVGVVLAVTAGIAQELWGEDKTLSPYFQVLSEDKSVDALPLLETRADVNIAGVIADVTVTQVYANEGKKPIEAIYVFPASTRAAVYGMKMTIGERVIVAEIMERQQAREEYERAKEEGKSASLLEQERPNVFQMNVANIMPGDTIEVELKYTELLVPTEGVYEFVYPTVVGPRYTTKQAAGADEGDRWVETPYTHEGEAPTYGFGITVNLSAGLPIQELTCATHKTDVAYQGLRTAKVSLDDSETAGGNRDYILRYRLTGGKVETGMLLYRGKDENFFLAMVQPPQRVAEADIPPREYLFIMDVSGSMNGFPIDISKKVLRDLIASLKPTDRFNVLLFAGNNAVMAEEPVAANEKNIEAALEVIDGQPGSGGTEILPALNRALALPRAAGMSRTVVIVTDGYIDVEPEVFDVIRRKLGESNMFAFGIGSGVNRHLIEGMAHVGQGEPFIVEEPEKAEETAEAFRRYIQTPVLTDVKVDFGGFEVYDVEPLAVPNVLAERPVIVFGKWRGEPEGQVRVTGLSGKKKYEQVFDLKDYPPSEVNAALRYLWARDRIRMLDDYASLTYYGDSATIKQVTELGLKYSLMTQYTSFVAIDNLVRNKDGELEIVKQPLPLPQGVSDYAVGADMSVSGVHAAPPPPMGKMQAPGRAMPETVAEEPVPVPLGTSLRELKLSDPAFEETVAAALEGLFGDIDSCYFAELARDPVLAGDVVVEFTIDPAGTISGVTVKKNELNAAVGDYIKQLLERLAIGLGNEQPVAVTATFELAP